MYMVVFIILCQYISCACFYIDSNSSEVISLTKIPTGKYDSWTFIHRKIYIGNGHPFLYVNLISIQGGLNVKP